MREPRFPNLAFTGWILVPPTSSESVVGVLSRGMERMGLVEGNH